MSSNVFDLCILLVAGKYFLHSIWYIVLFADTQHFLHSTCYIVLVAAIVFPALLYLICVYNLSQAINISCFLTDLPAAIIFPSFYLIYAVADIWCCCNGATAFPVSLPTYFVQLQYFLHSTWFMVLVAATALPASSITDKCAVPKKR